MDVSHIGDLSRTVTFYSTFLVLFSSNFLFRCARISATMGSPPSALIEIDTSTQDKFFAIANSPSFLPPNNENAPQLPSCLFLRSPARLSVCFDDRRTGLQSLGLRRLMLPQNLRLVITFSDALQGARPYPVADVIGTQQGVMRPVLADRRYDRWGIASSQAHRSRKVDTLTRSKLSA